MPFLLVALALPWAIKAAKKADRATEVGSSKAVGTLELDSLLAGVVVKAVAGAVALPSTAATRAVAATALVSPA